MVRSRRLSEDATRTSGESADAVEARSLLLDALDALEPSLPALVVGGGQAIDLRVPDAPPVLRRPTRDGDLTLDVRALARPPRIGERLAGADFEITGGAGHWARKRNRLLLYFARRWPVRVDVMVPDEAWPDVVAGTDPRASGHASNMAPMVVTLVDDGPLEIGAFDAPAGRRRTVRVAGPASLLLTKLHKFETRRLRTIARRRPFSAMPTKDVFDVLRLLLAADDGLERDLRRIAADPRGARIAGESLSFLDAHFASPEGLGIRLAREALAPTGDEAVAERAWRRAAAFRPGTTASDPAVHRFRHLA